MTMADTEESLITELNELRLDRVTLENAIMVLERHSAEIAGFRAVTVIECQMLISEISTKAHNIHMRLIQEFGVTEAI